MKTCKRFIAVAVFFLACFPLTALAQSSNPLPKSNEMTLWRARRILDCGFSGCTKFEFSDEAIDFESTVFRAKTPRHYTIALKTLDKLSTKCGYHGFGKSKWFGCEIQNSNGKDIGRPDPVFALQIASSVWGMPRADDENAVQLLRFKTECFVSALNRLHEHALHPESPLRNFSKTAADWRALTTRPPMPEEARVHRLVAEDEVKQKHPSLALFQYESALELFPTWPEGYFNAALIAAELELYPTAAEHMQSYLALVPDAPDAQTARDQIAIWKYKAKNK